MAVQTPNPPGPEKDFIGTFLIAAAIMTSVTFAFPYILQWASGHRKLDHLAQLGDQFTPLGTLFSGIASVGVIIAILIQREELKLQREELRLQRKELHASVEAQEASSKSLAEEVQLRKKLNQQELTLQLHSEWIDLVSTHSLSDLHERIENRFRSDHPQAIPRTFTGVRQIDSATQHAIRQYFLYLSKLSSLRESGLLDNEVYETLFPTIVEEATEFLLKEFRVPDNEPQRTMMMHMFQIEKLFPDQLRKAWFKD